MLCVFSYMHVQHLRDIYPFLYTYTCMLYMHVVCVFNLWPECVYNLWHIRRMHVYVYRNTYDTYDVFITFDWDPPYFTWSLVVLYMTYTHLYMHVVCIYNLWPEPFLFHVKSCGLVHDLYPCIRACCVCFHTCKLYLWPEFSLFRVKSCGLRHIAKAARNRHMILTR